MGSCHSEHHYESETSLAQYRAKSAVNSILQGNRISDCQPKPSQIILQRLKIDQNPHLLATSFTLTDSNRKAISKITKLTRPSSYREKITISSSRITDDDLSLLSHNFSELKTNPSLHMKFVDIKITQKGLYSFESLLHLHLPISPFSAQTNAGYKLVNAHFLLKRITELQIILSTWNAKELVTFSEGLSKITTLRSLFLQSFNSSNLRVISLVRLAEALEANSNLRNVELRFSELETDETGLTKILSSVKNLLYLNKFQTSFYTLTKLRNDFLRTELEEKLFLNRLTHLNITMAKAQYFDKKRVKENYANSLMISPNQLSQHLNLSFNPAHHDCHPEVRDSIFYLSEILQQTPLLVSLKLHCSGLEEIEAIGFKETCSAIGAIKNLETLKLYFDDCHEVNNDELIFLSENLKKLVYLKTLLLDFNHSKITDEGFEFLAKSLKQFSSLASLILKFANCENISSRSINFLAKSLERLFSLNFIELNFRGDLVSETGLEKVADALKKLRSLETILIDFSPCHIPMH